MHKCHVNHQRTHQTLYIMNQNHPCYLSSKDQTIFSALTNWPLISTDQKYKCRIRIVYFVLFLVYCKCTINVCSESCFSFKGMAMCTVTGKILNLVISEKYKYRNLGTSSGSAERSQVWLLTLEKRCRSTGCAQTVQCSSKTIASHHTYGRG